MWPSRTPLRPMEDVGTAGAPVPPPAPSQSKRGRIGGGSGSDLGVSEVSSGLNDPPRPREGWEGSHPPQEGRKEPLSVPHLMGPHCRSANVRKGRGYRGAMGRTGEQWGAPQPMQWGRGTGRVQPRSLGAELSSPGAGTCTRRDRRDQLTMISVHNYINLQIN